MKGAGEKKSRELRLPRSDSADGHLGDLMADVRNDSGSALQRLIDLLWAELVRYAAWEVADPDLAKDMVQEAFVYLWEHRKSWISVGSPRAYLYRIVQHKVIDYRRHTSVHAGWAQREKGRKRAGPPTPADVLAEKEVRDAFDRALFNLPQRRREAFYLVVLRGMPHREAAEVLGITAQTVANHVSSALQAIRRAIRETSDDLV